MYPQEDIHAQCIEDSTCLSTLLWLGSKKWNPSHNALDVFIYYVLICIKGSNILQTAIYILYSININFNYALKIFIVEKTRLGIHCEVTRVTV